MAQARVVLRISVFGSGMGPGDDTSGRHLRSPGALLEWKRLDGTVRQGISKCGIFHSPAKHNNCL